MASAKKVTGAAKASVNVALQSAANVQKLANKSMCSGPQGSPGGY